MVRRPTRSATAPNSGCVIAELNDSVATNMASTASLRWNRACRVGSRAASMAAKASFVAWTAMRSRGMPAEASSGGRADARMAHSLPAGRHGATGMHDAG